jgi:hypothetical protein
METSTIIILLLKEIMKKVGYLIVLCLGFGYGCRNTEMKNYRVEEKDSANISVLVSMLYPKEHLLVKVNDHIILDKIGQDTTGSPTGEYYFRYPDSIIKIEVISQYKGKVLLKRLFRDTLTGVAQRSIFISRPFPKGMTKDNYKPYGYVPIDSSDRNITLENDAVYYKGLWQY